MDNVSKNSLMVRLGKIALSLVNRARYTLMRGVVRSSAVRSVVHGARRALQSRRLQAYTAWKGRTPALQPRLLPQLQFALFGHGPMHERRAPDTSQRIA